MQDKGAGNIQPDDERQWLNKEEMGGMTDIGTHGDIQRDEEREWGNKEMGEMAHVQTFDNTQPSGEGNTGEGDIPNKGRIRSDTHVTRMDACSYCATINYVHCMII